MASRFWVGGTGTADGSDTTHWSATTGGVGGASVPGSSDAAVFDASSGAGTVTFAATFAPNSVSTAASSVAFVLGGNVALGGSNRLFNYDGNDLDLATFSLTTDLFFFSGTASRTLTFGAGAKIVLAGSANTIWNSSVSTGLTVVGTPTVELSYAGATGTRTINAAASGSQSENRAFNFRITGGTDTITLSSSRYVGSVDFTGFAGTLTNTVQNFYGDVTLAAGMTLSAGSNGWNFISSTQKLLTTNGKTLDFDISALGNTRLADNLTMGATRALSLGGGSTLDLNGKAIDCGSFASSNAIARTLAFGTGGSFTIRGAGATAWNTGTSTNLTITGTGSITMASASAKIFAGGGKSWPSLIQGGAGTLTVTGANSFTDIDNTVNGTTVTLPASVTTTVGALSLHGASGSVTTLNSSSSGTPATLSKASGGVQVSYLSIKDSTATGGAAFRAPINAGNVNVSGNTGWIFNAVGSAGRVGLGMGLGLTL